MAHKNVIIISKINSINLVVTQNDKISQWQSKMSVVQTTQMTIMFIISLQKIHDLY
jgi:hypothetical protein